MFIVSSQSAAQIIDLKTNISFDWNLKRPESAPFQFLDIYHTTSENEEVQITDVTHTPNPNAIRRGNREFVNFFDVEIKASANAVYIVLELGTLVKQVEVYVDRVRNNFPDDRQSTLFSGDLAAGAYVWYWDSKDSEDNEVDFQNPDGYQAICKFNSSSNRALPARDNDPNYEASLGQIKVAFDISWDPEDVDEDYLSIEKNSHFICATYASTDLQFESRPSEIELASVYTVIENHQNRKIDFLAKFTDLSLWSKRPEWADRIYVYASTGVAPPTYDYTEAIETGMDFVRIAEFKYTDVGAELQVRSMAVNEGVLSLSSFDHDAPDESVHTLGAYGVGIWAAGDNRVYFNKIGNQGEQRIYALPSENALVPHSFPLSKSGQSPILHIHPAAQESALLAFKRDAIHVIKGSGVISGSV